MREITLIFNVFSINYTRKHLHTYVQFPGYFGSEIVKSRISSLFKGVKVGSKIKLSECERGKVHAIPESY